MDKSPSTRTHDLGLAAALVSCGFELLGANREMKGGRVYFMFTKTEELGRAINDYWTDTLDVKARTFFDNTKMLKSRIYADE